MAQIFVAISASIQPNIASSASFEVGVLSLVRFKGSNLNYRGYLLGLNFKTLKHTFVQLNVEVIALGAQAILSVAYDVGLNVGMVSTPFLGTIGADMNVCTNISNFVSLNVSQSGALLAPGNTLSLFNQTHALLDVRELRAALFLA